jgi:DNA-binding MarR family transcriptional regulator
MNSDTGHSALLPLIVADIYELAGRFRAEGESIAATVGQTQARWQVMSAASAASLTVAQIARRLGVSRQNVQRIADLLVNEGWATYEPNPDHRGSPYLVLARRGQTALAQLGKAAARSHTKLAARLVGTDIGALHRALRRLIEAVNDRESRQHSKEQNHE